MRNGFERYGGDAYFNEAWRPVMIVDQGIKEHSKVGAGKGLPQIPQVENYMFFSFFLAFFGFQTVEHINQNMGFRGLMM